MARTQPRGGQILDNSINRDDIDVTTAGKALITKVIAGTGVTISGTGADSGTGDVTINASGSGTPVDIGFKVGMEMPYHGTVAPTGWLMEDGTTYLNADYPTLKTILVDNLGGTSSPYYISGTQFKVPDRRLKYAYGAQAETRPTVVFGEVATGNESAGISAVSPSTGAGGDVEILFVAKATTGTLPDPYSFSDLGSAWATLTSTSTAQLQVFIRRSASNLAHATVIPGISGGLTTNGMVAVIGRISGGDYVGWGLDTTSVATDTGADSTPDVTGLTTTRSNVLVFKAVASVAASVLTSTPPGGYTEQIDSGFDPGTAASLTIATRDSNAAGATGTQIFTLSGTPTDSYAFTVAIRPIASQLGRDVGGTFHRHTYDGDHGHGNHTFTSSTNTGGGANTRLVSVSNGPDADTADHDFDGRHTHDQQANAPLGLASNWIIKHSDDSSTYASFAANVGNGTDDEFVLTHNLGTRDTIVYARRNAAPYDYVLIPNEATTTNTTTLYFDTIPTTNQWRVTITALSSETTVLATHSHLTADSFSITNDLEEGYTNDGDKTGNVTLDVSSGGNHRRVRATGNVTFTSFSGFTSGKACFLTILMVQDGTGSRTWTFPAAVKWDGNITPVWSTGANLADMARFITFDGGTTMFGWQVGKGFVV